MTEDQVVTTGADVTALSGLELRKAVATALGWTTSDGTATNGKPGVALVSPGQRRQSPYLLREDDVWHYLPQYESSLDECFAPGGPVEHLARDGWGVVMTRYAEDHWWRVEFTHNFWDAVYARAEGNAEAVCRAFLTAVSERGQ